MQKKHLNFLHLIWLQILLHGGGLAQILERVFEKRRFSNRLNLFAIPDKRDKKVKGVMQHQQ